MSLVKAVKSQFSFFTIIPARADLEDTAKYVVLAPLLVGVTAGLLDWASFLAFSLVSQYLTLLTFVVVEGYRGFNHLDGLLDFGDAVMVKGGREDKLRALKDVNTGAGGMGFLAVYLVLFASSILSLSSATALQSLLSAEVLSRALGVSLVLFGRPMEGSFLGKLFREKAKAKPLIFVYPLLFSSPLQLVSFFLLFSLFKSYSEKSLGGVNGDVAGASLTLSTPVFVILQEVGDRFSLGYSPLWLSLSLLLSTLH